MKCERAGLASQLHDVLRFGRPDERRVDRRRLRRRGIEAERELSRTRHRRCGRHEVRVRGRQARDEAAELEIAEEIEDRGAVVPAPARPVDLEPHREVSDDRRHLAALEDLLPVRLEPFPQLRREARGVRVHALEVAVLRDELRRGLLADAGHARDVVGRIAFERLEVDHLRRPQAVALVDLRLVVHDGVLEAQARGEELDVRRDELERIEIARDDDDLEACCLALTRERADDVIGLVAGEGVHRHAEPFEQLLHALELRTQLVGHRLARRLVRDVLLVSEGLSRQIEGCGNVLRLDLLDRLQEDRGEAERRVREFPLGRRERRDREEAPVDEGVGVDEDETFAHLSSIAARGPRPNEASAAVRSRARR